MWEAQEGQRLHPEDNRTCKSIINIQTEIMNLSETSKTHYTESINKCH